MSDGEFLPDQTQSKPSFSLTDLALGIRQSSKSDQVRSVASPTLNAPDTIHYPTAASQDVSALPPEPHERLFSGRLSPDGNGGFQLSMASGESWPVITLDPSLHRWLAHLDQPKEVDLIGCANPWGPWLRASRLAG